MCVGISELRVQLQNKMIVVIKAWVLCEINLAKFLQMNFLFMVLLGLGISENHS